MLHLLIVGAGGFIGSVLRFWLASAAQRFDMGGHPLERERSRRHGKGGNRHRISVLRLTALAQGDVYSSSSAGPQPRGPCP